MEVSPPGVFPGSAETLGPALPIVDGSLVDGSTDACSDGRDDTDADGETGRNAGSEAGGRGCTVRAGLGRLVATSFGAGELSAGGGYEYVMIGASSAGSPAPAPPKSISAPGNCSSTDPGR